MKQVKVNSYTEAPFGDPRYDAPEHLSSTRDGGRTPRVAAVPAYRPHYSVGDGYRVPSADDLALTRRLASAGTLLGIEVVDHIVLGERGRFVSLKERGVL